jgi:Bacterial regulatory proteins, tetR family
MRATRPASRTTARAGSSSMPKGFGSTRSRMVSNCTSACCTSRLARGNAQRQTHSETSSNYRCTNDGQETGAMTPSRAPGTPRSEEHRNAVLKAAMELIQEDDLRRASVDRISARSGVSKATIYKWWPKQNRGHYRRVPAPNDGRHARARHRIGDRRLPPDIARHDGVLHQPRWRDPRPTRRRVAVLPN